MLPYYILQIDIDFECIYPEKGNLFFDKWIAFIDELHNSCSKLHVVQLSSSSWSLLMTH